MGCGSFFQFSLSTTTSWCFLCDQFCCLGRGRGKGKGNRKDLYLSLGSGVLLDLPLQSGGLSVRITCPYRQIALSPPKLVYPPGQFRIRSVFSTTGSVGAVTIRFHAESRFVQSPPEIITTLEFLTKCSRA